MAVNSTQIGNLLAIARAGSFTQAARDKGMSQPALSNSIALLEQRLGVRVLTRGRQGSTLTKFGEILVRRAEGIQLMLDDAEQEVQLSAKGLLGPLRIGATPSVLPKLLPQAIASLTAAAGQINLEIVEGLDHAFVDMLMNGTIDIVVGPIGDVFGHNEAIVETGVLSEALGIAISADHPLAASDRVSLADLTDAAWVLPRPGSNFRAHVEAMFRTHDFEWPQEAVLTNAVSMIEGLLRSSHRVAVVTPIQLSDTSGIKLLRLDEGGRRSIGYRVRARGELNGLGTLFLAHLRAAGATVQSPS